MMGWNMGGGGMFFGGFLGLLVLAAVVILVVLIVRGSGTQSSSTRLTDSERTASTPLEILQTRYAKGEIDREEYETKRRDLEKMSDSGR